MAVTEQYATLRQIQGALDASSIHVLNSAGESICTPIYNRRKHTTEFMCTGAYAKRESDVLDARILKITDKDASGKTGIFFTLDI